ncbi:MAG: BMP family ABC transporter substrate-binding protein [Sphaerochaeta sp.]
MKRLTVLIFAMLFSISLFASGAKEEPVAVETQDSNVVKIALIIENTIDDKGWSQAMHDGIIEAQEALPGRIEYSYSEKMKPVDAGSAARQYVAEGYDIIFGHGAQYKNIMLEMADEYPDTTFPFGTSSEVGPSNVFTYMPESEETGYLSGIIAGMVTKENVVGVVGPVDGGDAARYNRGFVLGVKSVNPDAKFMIAHTGSFSDYIKAGQVAQSQIQSGADVLTGSSQQALGALRAVADEGDKDIWWVGQDIAQLGIEEGYKCIAASSYNYKAVIESLVEKRDSSIYGGEVIPMNFKNGGFIFEFNSTLSDMYAGSIEDAVNAQLDSFKNESGLVDWKSVDYSAL